MFTREYSSIKISYYVKYFTYQIKFLGLNDQDDKWYRIGCHFALNIFDKNTASKYNNDILFAFLLRYNRNKRLYFSFKRSETFVDTFLFFIFFSSFFEAIFSTTLGQINCQAVYLRPDDRPHTCVYRRQWPPKQLYREISTVCQIHGKISSRLLFRNLSKFRVLKIVLVSTILSPDRPN